MYFGAVTFGGSGTVTGTMLPFSVAGGGDSRSLSITTKSGVTVPFWMAKRDTSHRFGTSGNSIVPSAFGFPTVSPAGKAQWRWTPAGIGPGSVAPIAVVAR